jgi:hypothetical protein
VGLLWGGLPPIPGPIAGRTEPRPRRAPPAGSSPYGSSLGKTKVKPGSGGR